MCFASVIVLRKRARVRGRLSPQKEGMRKTAQSLKSPKRRRRRCRRQRLHYVFHFRAARAAVEAKRVTALVAHSFRPISLLMRVYRLGISENPQRMICRFDAVLATKQNLPVTLTYDQLSYFVVAVLRLEMVVL